MGVEAEYAGQVRELAVLAPMLAVQLRPPSVQSGVTASAPPTGLADRSVARALETPGPLIMEVEEDVAMEVVEVRTTLTLGLLIMVEEEDVAMEDVEARTGNIKNVR